MKLYTGPLSLFSAKVRIALEEKRLGYDRVSVGWTLEDRYLPHHPDVVALNPRRQVPILVDGDTVVCDSTVILEYLEERHPEPAIFPCDPAGRARCRRLEALADEVVFPAVWDLIEGGFYPAPAADGADRDEARTGRARDRLSVLHRELDRELMGQTWLCDEFGVADIACFVMLSAAATLGAAPDPGCQALGAWMARTGERPSVRRDMQGMLTFMASVQPAAAGDARASAPEAAVGSA